MFSNAQAADLSITKSNSYSPSQPSDLANDTVTRGATITYTLVVTNHGPAGITGALVKDAPETGVTCAPGNAVTITGNGVPVGGPFTVANLTGAGITLGALANGQSAMLTFQCTVN